jgi:hypothetical protein
MIFLETDSELNVRLLLLMSQNLRLTHVVQVAIYNGWGYTVRSQADYQALTGDYTIYMLTKVPVKAS